MTGTVLDAAGKPVVAANIVIKGTTNGVTTDADGKFRLRGSQQAVTLAVSCVGYQPQEVDVAAGSQNIVVRLKEMNTALTEVVVVGYGTQKRTELTAAVSTMKGRDVALKPVADLSNSIVGRVAGVIANQGSGEPGQDGSTLRIRGSSTTGNAGPLLIVDGIPRSFSQLDPASIDNISVLKDAAAVAPYGPGGANGVILVTTKKGKSGIPTLTYNGYVGFQNPTRVPKMVNSYQFALFQNEAAKNSGLPTLPFSEEQIAQYKKTVEGAADADPDKYPNSKGIRDVLRRNALLTYHNLELSGGGERVRYYTALGFTSQQGQFNSTWMKKYNVTSRLDVKATPTTDVSLSLMGYVADYHYAGKMDGDGYASAGGGIMYQAFRTPPTSAIYYSNGLWGSYIGRSLVGYIDHSGYAFNENTQLYTTFSIEQQLPFIKGLSIKGVASYDPYNTFTKVWQTPVLSYTPDFSSDPVKFNPVYSEFSQPQLSQNTGQNKAFTYQGYLNYHNTFGAHDVTFLAVAEARSGKSWTMNAQRTYFPIDIDELDQGGVGAGQMTNGGSSWKNAQVGYVYRLGYNFKQKYFVELAGRYDGHYYFAPGHKYGFFPSASVGWNLAREEFFSKALPKVDLLKIRASYGESGNLAGSAYQYLAGYGTYGNAAIFNGSPTTGAYENSQPNKDITWERARKFDVGIDASIWNGLLTIQADYFYEKRSDMLVNPTVVVPVEYGIGLPQVNAGVMSNQGIDLSLGTSHTFGNGLRLDVTGTFTYAQNKLLQVFETSSTYNNPNRRRTGRANGTQFGLQSLGYFTPDDFGPDGKLKPGIASVPDAPVQPGDVKYRDISGPDGKPDGIIDDNDETVIGRPNGSPQIIYGLAPSLSWKGVDLNFLLQGAAQITLPVGGSLVTPFDQQGSATALTYTEHWTPANTDALYPRVYMQQPDYNAKWSSLWLRKADYLRLRSMELGYTLPASIIRNIRIQRLRVYMAGQNLWTWTPHMKESLDPEAKSSNGQYYFQQRTFSFGLNVTF
ncbi:SusC/RagA family TonB-linked outer membrane protein [Chitinophaga terrae (ex Kim and Jung 2007)]|uniref:SusC/RagA family TonB-linked outer membrane protein n=1 Tax=Chitinophaga terrae (ex Kim and Jung 2007) TaxID=408074 RepID=UPI0027D83927|nr:TonB-dependent receptor [Chitinophaga terrae (ex Kim and Jung 2007)]